MISLRTRLAVGVALIALLTASSIGLLAFFQTKSALEAELDQSLLNLARTEIASQVDSGALHVHEPDKTLLSLTGEQGYEKFAWIEDRSHNLLARTGNVSPVIPLSRVAVAERSAWSGKPAISNASLDGRLLRAIYYPLSDPTTGEKLVGVVGIPVKPVLDAQSRLRATIVAATAIVALASVCLGLIFALSVVQPLRRLTAEAGALDHGTQRISEDQGDSELRALASAMNRAIVAKEAAVGKRDLMIRQQNDFLSDASHELRTPVANIRGTAEVALRRPRSSMEYERELQTVLGEADRMGKLIEDLLLLASGDVDRLDLSLEPLDLKLLCSDALQAVSGRAQKRGISLSLGGDSVVVQGDRASLRRVIDNLLENSLRFARAHIRVTVRDFWVEVWNDGPMIPEDVLPRVFDRFYRSERARSRYDGGSGLGLSIVRAIAEAHGGSVRVENDEGVRFTLCLAGRSLEV